MNSTVSLDTICLPSKDVVARQIEDEMIIVPLVNGVGDLEGDLFTLNLAGQAIWQKLDGELTLGEVANLLASEFHAALPTLEKDVLDFAGELVEAGLLVVHV